MPAQNSRMKILLIPDSFKDSISSKDIIFNLKTAFNQMNPAIKIFECVASDGGEGFLDAVSSNLSAKYIGGHTLDPLQRPIYANYLLDEKSNSAYIELAQASGLELLKPNERNPLHTTTVGTGIQIMQAISQGANKIYVGVGGSATNDGGIGILSELGYTFKDEKGKELKPIGANLEKIHSIETPDDFSNIDFTVVTDVNNPLFGPTGAAFVYGKQKGANPSEIQQLDRGLQNLSKNALKHKSLDLSFYPGAGAAGGVAFGLMSFLNAKCTSGIDFLFEITNIEGLLNDEKIDFIITGEGSLDNQSINGKLISGISKLGKKHNIPVIAICGKLGLSEEQLETSGIYAVIAIAPAGTPIEESIRNAEKYIRELPKRLLPLMKN